ncbi:MAG: WG repeat-containing protein [Erysipelotrichaceae bacterium]|nr:WG repeat-containing protein [Erysipelotrichaceae bacterium]
MKKSMGKIMSCIVMVSLFFGCAAPNSSPSDKPADQSSVGYKVISEDVPVFQRIPISYKGKGYIAKVDDSFGFIDTNGEWTIAPDYPSISFYPSGSFHKTENTEGIWKTGVCMLNAEEEWAGDSMDAILEGNSMSYVMSGMGGAGGGQYVVNENQEVIWNSATGDPEPESEINNAYIVFDENVSYTDYSEYYLYVRSTNTLFGPYQEKEAATFVMIPKSSGIQSLHLFVHQNDQISGLFFAEEGGKYIVYTADGTQKTEEMYSKAKVISNDAVLVKKGDQWGIVDETLRFIDLKDPEIEEMSKPIDGKCYIRKNGTWMLVEITE